MNDEEVRESIAEEFRRIADDLESEEIKLTDPVRYTQHWTDFNREIPPEIEIEYYSEDGSHRTIEIY